MTKSIIFSFVCIVACFLIVSSFNDGQCKNSTGNGGAVFTMDDVFKTGKGKIIGTILNTNGGPIANVSVFAEPMEGHDNDNTLFSTEPVVTNSNGEYKIKRVPVGTYKVMAVPHEGDNFFSTDVFNVNVFARKTAFVDMKLSAKASAGATFIGSAVCKDCHSDKHSSWLKTAHANTHLPPSEDTVAAPFDNVIRFTSDGKVKFNAFISDHEYKVMLFDLNNELVSETYTVVRTHGGVAHVGKLRFHNMIGKSHYILPIQYNNRNIDPDNPDAAWVSYNPDRWYNVDGTLRTPDSEKDSYEQNCEGCHATGLSVAKSGSEFVSSSTEIGIGCEECHGPGSVHVATGGGNANNIINPEFLTVEMSSQVCGQCHIRVASMPGPNGANFETEYPSIVNGDEIVPYVFGNDLNDFISLTNLKGIGTPGYWNDNDESFGVDASENNHSKKHHQQYLDFSKSYHFEVVGLACFDCHSPHKADLENQLRLENDNNDLCLSCHPDKREMGVNVANGDELNVHTKHVWDPEVSKASRCSGCHMPKTAKSAVNNDIHSHVFDIIKPAISLSMAGKNDAAGVKNDASSVIMNACFSCHPEDDDYGVSRWLAWEDKVVE